LRGYYNNRKFRLQKNENGSFDQNNKSDIGNKEFVEADNVPQREDKFMQIYFD